MPDNLYVHFPFCRTKCSYCALYSRAGASQSDRDAYVRRLAQEIERTGVGRRETLKTVYFGGGSPALCDLRPILKALAVTAPVREDADGTVEFTVELHPLDVTDDLLKTLRDGGVNRISMGVQSLDDATLADMGRGYTVDEAERAFALVKKHFDNAGIDLIVGCPGEDKSKTGVEVEQWRERFFALSSWGLKHCSVYSLQNERGLKGVPDDDWTLDRIRHFAKCLESMGLERYEISNYAVPGYECRHNFAVWRGEDYLGLGEGAFGRVGLRRISNLKSQISESGGSEKSVSGVSEKSVSEVSEEEDLKERTIFRLRTREGLDASAFSSLSSFPTIVSALDHNVEAGLLTKSGMVYRLTDRGMEVCDSILAELV